MINADHAQGQIGVAKGELDRHGGLVKDGSDVVNGDRVVRVCSFFDFSPNVSYIFFILVSLSLVKKELLTYQR